MEFRFAPEMPAEKGVYLVYAPEYIQRDKMPKENEIQTCLIFILFTDGRWSIDGENKPSLVKAWLPVSEIYDNLNRT